jgi:uncharacterized membrane protein
MTVRPREPTADLLKGTALVLMIQVHIMEQFAQQSICDGWVGWVSLLLGGPPVAPVFVGILGYFAWRPQKTTFSLIRRGVLLLALGLMLNLGRAAHLLVKIQQGDSPWDPWPFILGVDILLLAGLSLIFIALVRHLLGTNVWLWGLSAIAIVLLTPAVSEGLVTEGPAKWVFAFLGGTYWWSYFPLFPWLAYALLGVAARLWREGQIETKSAGVLPEHPRRTELVAIVLSATVVAVTGSAAMKITHNLPSYYRHDAWFFLWVVIFVVAWSLTHALANRHLGRTIIAHWLKWMGRHVTIVYVWQWLIIGNVATAIYKEQELWQCCLWFAVVLGASNVLTAITVGAWSRIRGMPAMSG